MGESSHSQRRGSRRGRGQMEGRGHTHQFIFVKKLDEGGGNECVKSLQERIDLRLDGSRHPQLCHQLDVFSLRHTHTSKHRLEVLLPRQLNLSSQHRFNPQSSRKTRSFQPSLFSDAVTPTGGPWYYTHNQITVIFRR